MIVLGVVAGVIVLIVGALVFVHYSQVGAMQEEIESWILSKDELEAIGLSVRDEPTVELDKSFLGGGHAIVMYGEPTDLGLTVYFHDSEEDARTHYFSYKGIVEGNAETVLDRKDYGNEFVFVNVTNEEGWENVVVWYRFEEYVILMVANAEISSGQGRERYENFIDMLNEFTGSKE